MSTERFTLVLEARPDTPHPARAVARVLKYADKLGLRCKTATHAPDPGAWFGWRRPPDGAWNVVCTAVDEWHCRLLVANRVATGEGGEYDVLPRGSFPDQ